FFLSIIVDCREQILCHPLDTLIAIDLDHLVLAIIVTEKVDRLVKKDVQTFLYRFAPIVGALVQLTSIDVTDPRYLWRVRMDVVNVLVCSADVATRQPALEHITRNFQVNDAIYGSTEIF